MRMTATNISIRRKNFQTKIKKKIPEKNKIILTER